MKMPGLEKLYYGFLIVSTGGLGWLAMDSMILLQTGGGLDAIHESYHANSQLLTYGVPISFLILLALSFVLDWRRNLSRYYVWSGALYVLLTVVDYGIVCEMYFQWIRKTGQWKGGFSGAWILAAVFSLTGIIATTAALWITRTIKSLTSQRR